MDGYDEMHVQITLKSGEKRFFKDESLPTVAVQEMESQESLSDEPVCGAVLLLNRIDVQEPVDTVVPAPVQQLLDNTPQFLAPQLISLQKDLWIMQYLLPLRQKSLTKDLTDYPTTRKMLWNISSRT